jgi:hypothetical protein
MTCEPTSDQIERAYEMGADPHDIYLWSHGMWIQDVFPNLDNEEKEYILTGVEPYHWDDERFDEYSYYEENNPPVGRMSNPGDRDYES